MGTGARVFYAIGTFLALMAVFYIISTAWIGEDAWLFGTEWVGSCRTGTGYRTVLHACGVPRLH